MLSKSNEFYFKRNCKVHEYRVFSIKAAGSIRIPKYYKWIPRRRCTWSWGKLILCSNLIYIKNLAWIRSCILYDYYWLLGYRDIFNTIWISTWIRRIFWKSIHNTKRKHVFSKLGTKITSQNILVRLLFNHCNYILLNENKFYSSQ